MLILRCNALVIFALSIAACAERAPEPTAPAVPMAPLAEVAPPSVEVIHFACGDTIVEAHFFEGSLLLIVDGKPMTLSEVVAASGARYASGGDPAEIEFWSKGREAMLTIQGTRHPTCRVLGEAIPIAHRYRAIGQEPGWLLTWQDNDVALVLAAEEARVESHAIERISAEGGWILTAQTARGELRMVVEPGRLCRDSMSGMPYPDSVRLRLGQQTMDGCGGDPAALLQGGAWRVHSLDGEPVLAEPEATLTFLADGQVAGHATCNRYSGSYHLRGDGLRMGPIAATKMACMEPGLMAQEARFLDILGKAARFDFDEDGRLHIETNDGHRLIATTE